MHKQTTISIIAIILGIIIIAFPMLGVITAADILGLSVLLLAIFLLANGVSEVEYNTTRGLINTICILNCFDNLLSRNILDYNRFNNHCWKQRQQIRILDGNIRNRFRCNIHYPWNIYQQSTHSRFINRNLVISNWNIELIG